ARRVVDAAQQELLDQMRQRVPALRLGAVAGALGVLATAAPYRMNVLLLQRQLPPDLASFVAAAPSGGAARAPAMPPPRRWRGRLAPLPTDTARTVVEILSGADDSDDSDDD